MGFSPRNFLHALRRRIRVMPWTGLALLLPFAGPDSCYEEKPEVLVTIHPLPSDSARLSDNRLLGTWLYDDDTITVLAAGAGIYDFVDLTQRSNNSLLYLFSAGDSLEMAAWDVTALSSNRDAALMGASMSAPILVEFLGDTMILSTPDPNHLPRDSSGATTPATIPRGWVAIFRGSNEEMFTWFTRWQQDRDVLDEARYVRIRFGERPDSTVDE